MQQQSLREGEGEGNGSKALEESWFSLRAQVDPKNGKVWLDWGNTGEVGPVGNGAGDRALKVPVREYGCHPGGGRKPWNVLREEQHGLISI